MASALLTPSTGAVSLPYANASDFGAMEVTEDSARESVAAYGAAVYDPFRSSGTPHQTVQCTGFARANANNTQPFGALGGLVAAGGGAATFTLNTNTTITGNYIIGNVKLTHARLRAAVPLTWQMDNSGDPTITWPTA